MSNVKAAIVIDLGFGDGGKGRLVDLLSSNYKKGTVVVRFSGGQQCGHTVMRNGIKHVFSNYGSGTFNGCPSYFTEDTSVYLNTLMVEQGILRSKGFDPYLAVHPLAKLTTPYDVAWNRFTERQLNHGSCGLGIAATQKRHNETPYKLFVIDLLSTKFMLQKLNNIKEYYENRFSSYADLEIFREEYEMIEPSFMDAIHEKLFEIRNYDFLDEFDGVIFEGSQGVLLDMDHGIFPNVTFANTTSKNAINLCKRLQTKPDIFYVTRCYQTRHGNGWMSNESEINLVNNEEEINVTNEFQGKFRTGEIDYDLLEHSLLIDDIYSHGCTKTLTMTCLDQRKDFAVDYSHKLFSHVSFKNESHGPEGHLTMII